jgi:ABC-type antimicrobial peptide transport system permease subunit
MVYLRYIAAELRRRKGRTILTSLGLAVGVGLVVTVTALSAGLDDAQSEVLEPLTGVGTDMSVSRPLEISGDGSDQGFAGPPGTNLSSKEQRQLERENDVARFDIQQAGEPGEHFSRNEFLSTDLSFSAKEANRIGDLDGVERVATGLTVNQLNISGTVPESTDEPQVFGGPAGGASGAPEQFEDSSVSGVDLSEPDLGLVTRDQVTDGRYFEGRARDQAVLSRSYAGENDLAVGDEVTVGDKNFEVVGIADPPLGGESSDIYVELGQLQKLSDREDRINMLQVRATGADQVDAVAAEIESTFNGSEVTTAEELADRVSGSLVDAQNLSDKLGVALAIVALAAAVLIASLLTLSSVNKRIRELGTLKAVGWRQWLVVRQVGGESLAQGALGGLAGALIGIGGAALIGALGLSLEATAAATQSGSALGPFGQGDVSMGSSSVPLNAPVDAGMIVLAIGLATLGGLIAGSVGGLRAARLRPAEALRSVE